jgi:MarR family transcriptional regulator, organic hydroperoxide resistance regulator
MAARPMSRAQQDSLELEKFPPYLFHMITAGLNQRLLDRLRPHGVTVQRWRVLMVVANLGPRSMNELVQCTLIPQSALSRVIDQMERDGLVARWASKTDSRSVRVQLTDHGRSMYQELLPAAHEHADAIVAGFNKAEIAMFYNLLRRVLNNLNASDVRLLSPQD